MATAQRLKLPTTYAFSASPDGNLIAALGRNVVVANTRTLRKLSSAHPVSHPSRACFNGDGTLLAVKSTSGRIVVMRVTDSLVLCDHSNQREGEGSALHFSPCGEFLVDGSWAGQVVVREALRPSAANRFEFDGEMITGVSPSGDCQLWLVTHQPRTPPGAITHEPAYLTVWQWPLTKPKKTIRPLLANVESCVLSPDGKRIALVGLDETLGQWALQVLSISGKELCRSPIDTGGTGSTLRWSADGASIGSIQRGRIAVYASADLSESASYPLEYPSDICFSSDHSFIALGTWTFGLVERVTGGTPNPSIERTPSGLRRPVAAHVKR